MARELTFAEMRDSRRFAWHPHGYLSLTASSFALCVWSHLPHKAPLAPAVAFSEDAALAPLAEPCG